MNNLLVLGFIGHFELIAILVFFIIPVSLIILAIRFVIRSGNEKRRLRLEVGKVADELEQLKKQNGESETIRKEKL